MPLTVKEIEVEYHAALADAKIDPQRVRLYLSKSMGKGHLGAVWHPPGLELVVDEQFPDRGQLADANDPKHRRLHRIVAPAEPSDAITFAALFRHELEHARQYDALGTAIFDLQHFLERDVLPHKAGGLDGCAGSLINAVPTEIDANAAASVYITGRFTEDDLATLRQSQRSSLGCSIIGPEPFDSLPARMIAFAFIHRSAVHALAAVSERPVADMLDERFPDAAALWARLEQGLNPQTAPVHA
jgi:hypothetical protein